MSAIHRLWLVACSASAVLNGGLVLALWWTYVSSEPAGEFEEDAPVQIVLEMREPEKKMSGRRVSVAEFSSAPAVLPLPPPAKAAPRIDVVLTPNVARIDKREFHHTPAPRRAVEVDRSQVQAGFTEPVKVRRRTREHPEAVPRRQREPRLPKRVAAATPRPALSPPVPVGVEGKQDLSNRLLYNPPAYYPPSAMQAGRTGTVWVMVWVTAEGRVGQMRLHTSSGHWELDAAALRMIRTWRFRPDIRDGRPVGGWVTVYNKFSL